MRFNLEPVEIRNKYVPFQMTRAAVDFGVGILAQAENPGFKKGGPYKFVKSEDEGQPGETV